MWSPCRNSRVSEVAFTQIDARSCDAILEGRPPLGMQYGGPLELLSDTVDTDDTCHDLPRFFSDRAPSEMVQSSR